LELELTDLFPVVLILILEAWVCLYLPLPLGVVDQPCLGFMKVDENTLPVVFLSFPRGFFFRSSSLACLERQ
jgi:hypothetical protein